MRWPWLLYRWLVPAVIVIDYDDVLTHRAQGMEYGVQCFCDNFARNYPSTLPDSKCSMACGGNTGEHCGAGNVISVYSNGTITDYADPTIQTTGVPGSWKYQGCLSDAGDNRALPWKMVFPTNNSNTNCLSQCQTFGYGAAGAEYGQECYCGDVSNVMASGQTMQPDSQCNMVCTNDTTKPQGAYYCGAGNGLSYYTWTGKPLTQWSYAQGNAAGK